MKQLSCSINNKNSIAIAKKARLFCVRYMVHPQYNNRCQRLCGIAAELNHQHDDVAAPVR